VNGTARTILFAVTREGGLQVKSLPIGEERLRKDVDAFLERIRSQEPSADLASSLYHALVGPASPAATVSASRA